MKFQADSQNFKLGISRNSKLFFPAGLLQCPLCLFIVLFMVVAERFEKTVNQVIRTFYIIIISSSDICDISSWVRRNLQGILTFRFLFLRNQLCDN